MTTRFVLLGLLIAAPPAAAQVRQAQQAPRFTLGINAGGSSPGSDLTDGTGWKSGWSAGANLTYRLTANLGVRAAANLSQNYLSGGVAIPGEQRFNKISYMGDAVWQFTGMPAGRIAPYALAGLGAVRLHDKGSDSSFTRFAGDVGLGVGYRLGRFGVRAEGRNLVYKFARFGYSKMQNDFIWQAGVTLGI